MFAVMTNVSKDQKSLALAHVTLLRLHFLRIQTLRAIWSNVVLPKAFEWCSSEQTVETEQIDGFVNKTESIPEKSPYSKNQYHSLVSTLVLASL